MFYSLEKNHFFNFKNHLFPNLRISYCRDAPLFTQGILGNLVTKCINIKHTPLFQSEKCCNLGDYIPN